MDRRFTYGVYALPRSGRPGQAKQDFPLHGDRLLYQPVMKQHRRWKIFLSAGNDSWEQQIARPVILSALCFQSTFQFSFWNCRSLIWVCERCRNTRLLTKLFNCQSKAAKHSAVSACQRSGSAAAGNFPSISIQMHFSFLRDWICKYTYRADWLEPGLLHVNDNSFKSMYCMRLMTWHVVSSLSTDWESVKSRITF